jgi:hypothetical protein
VGTNVDYTIGLVRSWRAVERGSCYFARRDPCFRRAAPRAVDVEAFDSNIQRPGASTRDRKLSSCISQRNLTGSARAGA